jgi:hypothetical protein
LGISWFRTSGPSSLFFEVKIAEEDGEVGDKGSGYTTTVDIQTLLEALVIMSLRSACFIDEVFFVGGEEYKAKLAFLGLLACYGLSPWLISNLKKNLIYLHIIHLLKSSTCFKHYSAHLHIDLLQMSRVMLETYNGF